MQILIREAIEEDIPYILRLYEQPDMDDGEILSLEEAESISRKISNYPYYKIYVAISDTEIVATFALTIIDNMAHLGAPSGIIEDVVVKAERQGEGIGKQMMNYATNLCSEYGCYKVALSSNLRREKAHYFYESLGFKKHGYSFVVEP